MGNFVPKIWSFLQRVKRRSTIYTNNQISTFTLILMERNWRCDLCWLWLDDMGNPHRGAFGVMCKVSFFLNRPKPKKWSQNWNITLWPLICPFIGLGPEWVSLLVFLRTNGQMRVGGRSKSEIKKDDQEIHFLCPRYIKGDWVESFISLGFFPK